MADETPQKPKITLKETDTSRLKSEAAPGAPKPVADETPQKPKVTLTQSDTARLRAERAAGNLPPRPATPPLPPPADSSRPGQTVKLTDPLALRDTNTGHLRRIEPGATTPASAAAAAPGQPKRGATETVRLKVVREQKKEEPPDLSQTARLRPPTVAVPPGGGAAEPSLKVSPLSDASKTVTIKTPVAPPPVVETAKTQPAQKVEEGKTATSRLTRVSGTKAAVAATPADGSAHHTVKIKLPVGPDETQDGDEPSATAVLPAPGEGAAATVKLPAESIPGAKRTIRMRNPRMPAGTPAAVEAVAAMSAATAALPAEAPEVDTVTTVALVVMLLGLGAMLYFLITQVMAHVL